MLLNWDVKRERLTVWHNIDEIILILIHKLFINNSHPISFYVRFIAKCKN
jgi:hypothetical protein